ncbi:MAG: glycoside hydrolase family 88 protein [Niabella sp.]
MRFKLYIAFNFLGIILLNTPASFAQLPVAVEAVKKVAAFIMDNTSYTFIDTKSGARYSSTLGLPADINIKAESIYNKWEYSNGVMAIGMMELSKTLDDTVYESYVGRNFGFVFDNIRFFENQYAENNKTEFYNFIRMDRLDDMGALSAALTRYDMLQPRPEYKAYLQKAINYLSSGQTRLADQTLCRKGPREMTIWADDLYMSVQLS